MPPSMALLSGYRSPGGILVGHRDDTLAVLAYNLAGNFGCCAVRKTPQLKHNEGEPDAPPVVQLAYDAEAQLRQLSAEMITQRALQVLDERVLMTLGKGDIRLLSADFLRNDLHKLPNDGAWVHGLCSRQEMERLGNPDVFVPNEEAQRMIRQGRRLVGMLTYGWSGQDHADSKRTYLKNVSRFLRSEEGRHIEAVFWDQPCLYQYRRTPKEDEAFRRALMVMGDLYASILGTTVIRHKELPPAPKSDLGTVRVYGIPNEVTSEVVQAEFEKLGVSIPQASIYPLNREDPRSQIFEMQCADEVEANRAVKELNNHPPFGLAGVLYMRGAEKGFTEDSLRASFQAFDYEDTSNPTQLEIRDVVVVNITEIVDEAETCWRVQFATHDMMKGVMRKTTLQLQRVDARLPEMRLRPLMRVARKFNSTLYDDRGWPQLETAVGEEGVRRASFYPRLKQHLDTLTPKFYDIGSGPPVENKIEPDKFNKSRTQEVLSKIRDATFTNSADFTKVQELYEEYAGRINRTVKSSGESVQGRYDGQRNIAGVPDGKGTMTYEDGDVYTGAWRQGKQHGWGETKGANEKHYKGAWEDGQRQGEGQQTFGKGGSMYSGGWRAGDPHGTGVMLSQKDFIFTGMYDGDYRAGKREGFGTWQFNNGDTYRGRWSGGRIDGAGLYQAAEGYTISGKWQRIEWRDARKNHLTPDGHALKLSAADRIYHHWDPDRPGEWRPISLEDAEQLRKEHRLPEIPELGSLPSVNLGMALTKEHYAPFEGMPAADEIIRAEQPPEDFAPGFGRTSSSKRLGRRGAASV